MPTMQSTYASTLTQAVEGMIANSEPNVIVSRIAEDAEGIGFGKVCVMGSADNLVVDSETTVKFEGIAVLDPTQPSDTYAQYATVNVMKRGVIWVMASEAVAKGDAVYYTPATGVLSKTSTSNTLIANASWDSTTAGAALAKLRLA